MVAAWRELNYCGQGCFCHRLEKVSEVFIYCTGHRDTQTLGRRSQHARMCGKKPLAPQDGRHLQSIVFSNDWLRQPVFWFVQFLFVFALLLLVLRLVLTHLIVG
jgi:hypothetical protein